MYQISSCCLVSRVFVHKLAHLKQAQCYRWTGHKGLDLLSRARPENLVVLSSVNLD